VLQINFALGKAVIWDYSPPPLVPWFSTLEADIGFKLPNNTRLFYGKKPRIKRSSYSVVNPLHRIERLEFFRNIEGFMDMYVLEYFNKPYFCDFRSENLKNSIHPSILFVSD
jgi:hypothetical protein